MDTKKPFKIKSMPYILILLVVIVALISWGYFNNKVHVVEPLPTTPFVGALVLIPEGQVEGFNINKLAKDDIFNWGIEGQANVGLAYDKTNGFNLMADVVDRTDKSSKPKHKFYQSNNQSWPVVEAEGEKFLSAYGYKIDFNNSKDLKQFIEFMSK